MKKLVLFLLTAAIFYGCSSDNGKNNEGPVIKKMVSFTGKLTQAETEYTTTDGVKDGDYMRTSFKDNDGIIEFNHYYSTWGFGGGFTYTNKTDKTTAGYGNNSAITGAGVVASQPYLTSNTSSFTPAKLTNLKPDKYTFGEVSITNSTYAYLAIKDGNDGGYGGVRKFAAGDYFKLTITGYTAGGTEIGKIPFYLADFRDSKTEIINTWKAVDLTSLAAASYLTFSLESTDNGEWGMNTPSYFCLDGLTMVEK